MSNARYTTGMVFTIELFSNKVLLSTGFLTVPDDAAGNYSLDSICRYKESDNSEFFR